MLAKVFFTSENTVQTNREVVEHEINRDTYPKLRAACAAATTTLDPIDAILNEFYKHVKRGLCNYLIASIEQQKAIGQCFQILLLCCSRGYF